MAFDTTSGRRPRADAARNRAHILRIAEGHFAQHGIAGSLDAIAREAGVGAGTLYRHFPTREALLAALLAEREQDLNTAIDVIHQSADGPDAALARWLEVLQEYTTAFAGLPEPLRAALEAEASPLAPACHKYLQATEGFLAAAQRAGAARADVSAGDLFLAVLAIAWASMAPIAGCTSAAAQHGLLSRGWAASQSSSI